jgi:hypothetical protein
MQRALLKPYADTDAAIVIDEGDKYAISIVTRQVLQEMFAAPDGLVPIVDAIRLKVAEFTPDITTKKGRDEIRSMAAKVTRSKTLIDGIGKDLVAELKDLPRRIDANRKLMRDQLDALAEDTRRPLTEYDARIEKYQAGLRMIRDTPGLVRGRDSDAIRIASENLGALLTDEWGEFLDEATAAVEQAQKELRQLHVERVQAETQERELAQLRAEAEERERRDREAAHAKEIADRARREAEEEAERERQAALGREAEAKRQAELAEQRAAEAERREKESARLAAERAEQAAREATEAERRRQEEEARHAQAEKERREADVAHRRQINTEAIDDIENALAEFPEFGGSRVIAREVAKAIASGKIRHVRIEY